MFFLIWVASIIITVFVANYKHLDVAQFTVLSVFLGPIALVIALLSSPSSSQKESFGGLKSWADTRDELNRIRRSLSSLQEKIADLERNINKFSQNELSAESAAPDLSKSPAKREKFAEESREGLEFVFGKYWLNRIGVVIFVLGVAFFISYTFKYLNAFAKILIGYFFAAAFFVWGNILEKKQKYIKISWGILAGAWGLLYFSTYATHFIEATQIITSPLIGLWLLAIVSIVTIIYNLKYKSWVVTSLTFLLAFITAGLGRIEYSTVAYCALLTAAIVYISFKLKWYEFLLFGICGTYITYMAWLHPQIFDALLVSKSFSIPVYQFQLSFGILSISWFLFSLVLILLRADGEKNLKFTLWGILLNACFYVILGLSEIYSVRPHLDINWDVRFWFLIALAGVYALFSYLYKKVGRGSLIVSNVGIAFSLLAMAIMIKFSSLSVGFFWMLEMVLLFILGVYYKEIIYRMLAGLLSILIMVRLFVVDYYSGKYYTILGFDVKHNILIFIFCAICFYILGALLKNKYIEDKLTKQESDLFSAFVVFATTLLTFLFGKEAQEKWLSSIWAIEGIVILAAGFLLGNKVYRICALCVLSLASLRLFFIDLAGMNTIYRIAAFIFLGAILLTASLVYSKFIIKEKQ